MTIIEIEAKKTQLEATIATSLEATKVLSIGSAEFDEAYGRYLKAKADLSKIPDELAKAKLDSNKVAIDKCAATVCESITQLIEGLKVAELIGKPVISLRYYRIADEGKPVSQGVVFNPITRLGAQGASKATTGKSTGHKMVVAPDGSEISVTKFVRANLTEDQKDENSKVYVKYPHILCDTQAKFDKFCADNGLVGYSLKYPEKATSEGVS